MKKRELSAWVAACSCGTRQRRANALCRRAPNHYEGYVFEWNAQSTCRRCCAQFDQTAVGLGMVWRRGVFSGYLFVHNIYTV